MAQQERQPNAAGGFAQWTPFASANNHDEVDDHPDSNDGDSTYNSTSTNNQADRMSFAVFTVSAGSTINWLRGRYAVKSPSGAVASSRQTIVVDGGAFHGTQDNYTDTSYVVKEFDWTTNPDTGLAWTVDDINGVAAADELQEMGYQSRDPDDKRVTADLLLVDYTESGAGGHPGWQMLQGIGI